MVIMHYYLLGFIATFMLAIFHNLLINNRTLELDVVQMMIAAMLWPFILPLLAVSWTIAGIVYTYQKLKQIFQ